MLYQYCTNIEPKFKRVWQYFIHNVKMKYSGNLLEILSQILYYNIVAVFSQPVIFDIVCNVVTILYTYWTTFERLWQCCDNISFTTLKQNIVATSWKYCHKHYITILWQPMVSNIVHNLLTMLYKYWLEFQRLWQCCDNILLTTLEKNILTTSGNIVTILCVFWVCIKTL